MFQRRAWFAPRPCRLRVRLRARSLVQVAWPSRVLWLDGASAPSSSGHRRFDTGTFRARRLDLAWWSAIHLTQHSNMTRDSLEGCANSALREEELAPRPPMRRLLPIGAKKAPAAGGCCRGRGGAGGGLPAPVHGRGEAMEMREPRAHEIAREAAACLAEIDETIPVLLEAMVLGEMADIGPARWPFSRRVADISRHRRSGKEVCRWPPSGRSGVESFTRA
jgi:uncharacterized protein YheU (UPF0270 family)